MYSHSNNKRTMWTTWTCPTAVRISARPRHRPLLGMRTEERPAATRARMRSHRAFIAVCCTSSASKTQSRPPPPRLQADSKARGGGTAEPASAGNVRQRWQTEANLMLTYTCTHEIVPRSRPQGAGRKLRVQGGRVGHRRPHSRAKLILGPGLRPPACATGAPRLLKRIPGRPGWVRPGVHGAHQRQDGQQQVD